MADRYPDPNLRIKSKISDPEVKLLDVRQAPFSIYGLYNPCAEPQFKRIPDDVATATSPGAAVFALTTTGGRVRFSTDSPYIAIRAEMPDIARFEFFSLSGSAGFDLYVDDPESGDSFYRKPFIPSHAALDGVADGFESRIDLPGKKKRYFTIHFPLWSQVKNLFVGVQKDAVVNRGASYRSDLPIVFYGSSITQGGFVSHPGNAYPNLVGRRMNLDHMNFGLAGNGKGEDAIADYMASLPMLAFICDYDYNAPSVDHLRATHRKLYETIRKNHPDIPYLMISRPNFIDNPRNFADRRDVILETLRYAREQGDRNVWFVDGSSIYRGKYQDCCTVDGVHPNDFGHVLFAEKIEEELRHALMSQHFVFDC